VVRQVEFPLEGGGFFLVEVDEAPSSSSGLERAGAAGEIIERGQQTLQNALEKIKPMASAAITKIRELNDAPDEVTIEFGIKLTAEGNVVLSKAAVEGNYKLTLSWKK